MQALQLAKKEQLQRTLKTPAAKELLQITRMLVVRRKKGVHKSHFSELRNQKFRDQERLEEFL
jgi:hypothetical protein